jgi:hypothetical protein
MRKFLIFHVLIIFLSTLVSVPVLVGERVEKRNETDGFQQYEPVKWAPDSTDKEDKDPYVYITEKGERYHLEGCSYLRESKIKIRLSEAKRRGYKPCPRCQPQEKEKGSR